MLGATLGCTDSGSLSRVGQPVQEPARVEDPPGTSRLWKQYREARQTGGEPVLADFSYAGYHWGEEPLPAVDWKVFDVTQFGAVPDDGRSDRNAFTQAIAAAEANGSGVVFFPAGRFLINEPSDPHNQPIVIRGSKGPVMETSPGALHALACVRGWTEFCGRGDSP